MKTVRISWLLVALGASPLAGQATEEGALAATAERGWCFVADPAPSCRSYPILEVQGIAAISSTSLERRIGPDRPAFDEWNLEFNLGHVVNVSPRWSVGALLTLGTGVGGFDGARGRVRYWASPNLSLEADAGVVRTNLGSYAPVSSGPSLALRASLFDVAILLLRYDRVDVPDFGPVTPGPQSGLSAGMGVSGPIAIAASGLIGIGVAILVLVLAGSTS